MLSGSQPKGFRWQETPLRNMLKSPTSLGYAVERVGNDVKVVYGTDGKPRRQAREAIISEADFRAVQEVLKARKLGPGRRSLDNALLLQVIYCGECGEPMHRLAQPDLIRYRCRSAKLPASERKCQNGAVPLEWSDKIVSDFLLMFESREIYREVYRPGTDNSDRLADLAAQIERIVQTVAMLTPGTPSVAQLAEQLNTLEAERTELEGQPNKPGGYDLVRPGRPLANIGRNWTRRDATISFDGLTSGSTCGSVGTVDTKHGVRLSLGTLFRFLGMINPALGDEFLAKFMRALAEKGYPGMEFETGQGEPPAYDGSDMQITIRA